MFQEFHFTDYIISIFMQIHHSFLPYNIYNLCKLKYNIRKYIWGSPMGLLRKLFGPSLDELVELELKLKHKREIHQISEAAYLVESIDKAEAVILDEALEKPKENKPHDGFYKMNLEDRIEYFYKNSFSKISNSESITTKLIAFTNEESQGNLAFKSVYDKVSFDYDFNIDAYVVADEYGEILGKFSKSVSEKIKQKKSSELLGFIKSVDISHDTDQYTADIIIYFI